MNLDAQIKKCNFTRTEIQIATFGECMWFATALHRILKANQIKNEMVLAASGLEFMAWSHVMIELADSYYDIRGKVNIREVHKTYNTKIIRYISEKTYREEYERFEPAAHWDKITAKYHDRLIGAFQ